jgi:integrase
MARETKKLNDKEIKRLIKAGEPFEVGDGDGLWLRLRKGATSPVFRFRYRFAGEARVMVVGDYRNVPLAEARKTAQGLRGKLSATPPVDIAEEARKADEAEKANAKRNVYDVTKLSAEFYKGKIETRVKHPKRVSSLIEKNITPYIGHIPVKDVKPRDIRAMLNAVKGRGYPTIANDVLWMSKRIFDEAVKDGVIDYNPAAAFDQSDAGGEETARKRALDRGEIVKLFDAMRKAPGFSVENAHAVKLLLLLAVRKNELAVARVAEFDLDKGEWKLPGERTKTGADIDIPLPAPVVRVIRELVRLGRDSKYLLPARKEQTSQHVASSTLNVAMGKVRRLMPGVESFTVHDFRRTARTQLAALKVPPHVAEKCLNHKIKGVAGVYDAHDYFDERRDALDKWADLVEACEAGAAALAKWERKHGR